MILFNQTYCVMNYSILGTVSPSSLGEGSEMPDISVVEAWASFLQHGLLRSFPEAKQIDIRVAPFGGTRLRVVGSEEHPDFGLVESRVEELLDDYCFNLEELLHHDLEDGFPKPGDNEC